VSKYGSYPDDLGNIIIGELDQGWMQWHSETIGMAGEALSLILAPSTWALAGQSIWKTSWWGATRRDACCLLLERPFFIF